MHTESLISFILCIASGLFTMWIGWLIWKKKHYHLLASFNLATYKGDLESLAKFVGQFALFVGGITFILPFALEFVGAGATIIYGILAMGAVVQFFFKTRNPY